MPTSRMLCLKNLLVVGLLLPTPDKPHIGSVESKVIMVKPNTMAINTYNYKYIPGPDYYNLNAPDPPNSVANNADNQNHNLIYDEEYQGQEDDSLFESPEAPLEGIIAPGKGVVFDGSNKYLKYEDQRMRNVEETTLGAWFYFDSQRMEAGSYLQSQMHIVGHPHGRGARISLRRRSQAFYTVKGDTRYVTEGAYRTCTIQKQINLNDNKWHHAALVINQTLFTVYLDFEIIRQCTLKPKNEVTKFSPSDTIHLGSEMPNSQAFVGTVDEVVYLNRAITETQLREIGRGFFRKDVMKHILLYTKLDGNLEDEYDPTRQWKTSSGDFVKYKTSHAMVTGKLIAREKSKPRKTAITVSAAFSLVGKNLEILEGKDISFAFQLHPHYESGCSKTFSVRDSKGVSQPFVLSPGMKAYATGFEIQHITEAHCSNKTVLEVEIMITQNVSRSSVNLHQTLNLEFDTHDNIPPFVATGGMAIECDGQDDYLFNENFTWPVETYGDYRGGAPITIEYWAMSESYHEGEGAIINIGNGQIARDWVDAQNPFRKSGPLYISSTSQDSGLEAVVGSSRIASTSQKTELNKWTHYALTHDQANGTSAKLYINGEMVEKRWHNHEAVGQPGERAVESIIDHVELIQGLSICTSTFYGNVYHKGFLDEIRIWKGIRSEQEIRDNMNRKVPTNSPNLMAYYDFDEPKVGGIISDLSPNGFDLKFGGCAPCTPTFMGFQPLNQDYEDIQTRSSSNSSSYCTCGLYGKQNYHCISGAAEGPPYESPCGNRVCNPSIRSKAKGIDDDNYVFGGHPCYYTPSEMFKYDTSVRYANDKWPKLVPSLAPIEGTNDVQVVAPYGHLPTLIYLNASTTYEDNLHKLIRKIVSFPKYGQLLFQNIDANGRPRREKHHLNASYPHLPRGESKIYYEPLNPSVAGQDIDTFSFVAFDDTDYSPESQVEISILCPAGHFVSNSSQMCTPCPAGTFSPDVSFSTSCTPCPEMQYQALMGQRECHRCPRNQVAVNSSTCVLCASRDIQSLFREDNGPLVQHIHMDSCPVLIPVVQQPQSSQVVTKDLVIQFNVSEIANDYIHYDAQAPLKVLISSIPSKGTLYQYLGVHPETGEALRGASLSTFFGAKARTNELHHQRNLYLHRVLKTCDDAVTKVSDQTNATTFGLLGPPDISTYGSSMLAWGLCTDRPYAYAYEYNSIEAQIIEPLFITQITIFENFRPGGVFLIEGLVARGEWQVLWRDITNSGFSAYVYRTFQVDKILPTEVPVDRIRITLHKHGRNRPSELDAVLITGFRDVMYREMVPISDPQHRLVYVPDVDASSIVYSKDHQHDHDLKFISNSNQQYVEYESDEPLHLSYTIQQYSSSSIDLQSQAKFNLGTRRANREGRASTSREMAGDSQSKSGIEVIILLSTFIPMSFFLTIFVILFGRYQRKKQALLNLKLQKSQSTIPQSAIVASADVRIFRQIGQGGGGIVYLGAYRGMKVAIKRISCPELEEASKDIREEVQNEAQRMVSLRHPNIVIFMGCCLEPNNSFIVSQYCERGSLYDLLHDYGQSPSDLSWVCRLRLAVGATRGLLYLHSASPPLIHRDIKSANILVDEAYTSKLADFGTLRVARVLNKAADGGAGQQQSTNTHHRLSSSSSQYLNHSNSSKSEASSEQSLECGTLRWTAPEILLGRIMEKKGYPEHTLRLIQYSTAVDIYSLGMVLWEIGYRQIPYYWLTFMYEVEEEILSGRPPQFPENFGGAPNGYAALVKRCLSWEPADRPKTDALLQALEELLATEEDKLDQMYSSEPVSNSANNRDATNNCEFIRRKFNGGSLRRSSESSTSLVVQSPCSDVESAQDDHQRMMYRDV